EDPADDRPLRMAAMLRRVEDGSGGWPRSPPGHRGGGHVPVRTRSPDHPVESDPVRRRLIVIGLGSLPVYGVVAILSTSFRYGEGHRQRPILAVLGLLALAWVGYALALAGVLGRCRSPEGDPAQREAAGHRLPVVLAFAIVFRLILLVSTP